MKNPALPLFALLAIASTPAIYAQGGGAAYYGAAIGNFEYEEGDGFGGEFIGDKVSSYRLMIAYQFMENLGVEGGYGETSTIRETFTLPTFPSGTVDLNFSAEFKILTVRLVGILPFDNGLSLIGGLGYSDMTFDFSVTDGVNSISDDESENNPGYYVGVQYDWDRFAMRLGYEKFDLSDDRDASEAMLTFFYKI